MKTLNFYVRLTAISVALIASGGLFLTSRRERAKIPSNDSAPWDWKVWKLHSSPDGAFQCLLPDTPRVSVSKSTVGNEVLEQRLVSNGPLRRVKVRWTKVHVHKTPELSLGAEKLRLQPRRKITKQRDIELQGLKGFELELEGECSYAGGGDGDPRETDSMIFTKMRVLAAKDRLYSFEISAADKNLVDVDAARVYGSIAIKVK